MLLVILKINRLVTLKVININQIILSKNKIENIYRKNKLDKVELLKAQNYEKYYIRKKGDYNYG